MSLGNFIRSKIEAGLKPYIPMVINANRDFPYHDYKKFEAGVEPAVYNVGEANREAHGDQTKLFVSQQTLIYSDGACTIRFNNAENVLIDILAAVTYMFESNIKSIHVISIAAEKTLYCYFEGVLPEEARSPL